MSCFRADLLSMTFNMDPKKHYLDPKDTSIFRVRQLVSQASLPRLLY